MSQKMLITETLKCEFCGAAYGEHRQGCEFYSILNRAIAARNTCVSNCVVNGMELPVDWPEASRGILEP